MFLSILIAGGHLLSLKFFWYWTTWWADTALHFLAGTFIAIVMCYLIISWQEIRGLSFNLIATRQAFLLTLIAVIFIGIIWEFFEIYRGLIIMPDDFNDSLADMAMDIIGGISGYLFLKKK